MSSICSARLLAAIGALMLLEAPTLSAAPVTELSVMSFNIWGNGGWSLSQCVEAMRLSGADLVGLQECSPATAQSIATNLGFSYLGVNDVSIVSRYPIVATHTVSGGSGVLIELSPGQRVHLFNCHLAAYPYGPYSLREGKDQAFVIDQENATRMPALRQLLNGMAPHLDTSAPCFLVGDFNAPSHLDYATFPWPTSLACADAGLLDAYRAVHSTNLTYPPAFAFDAPGITWTPLVSEEPYNAFDRIDFVYYSDHDGLSVLASTELDGRNSANPWPSDHRAVLARFALALPAQQERASQPTPASGATNVVLAPLLSWVPGSNTLSHQVYFGPDQPGTFQTNTTNTVFAPAALQPNRTYYWRVDETKASGVVTGDVWSFTTLPVRTYEWTFDHADLSAAFGQGLMTYAGGSATASLTTFGTTDGVTVPHVAGQPASYLRAPGFADPQNGYHLAFPDSGPNGGGIYLNQYTLILDLLIPAPLGWVALFNTNPQNANDADFYIDPSGRLGIGAIGYSAAGAVVAGRWHRVAFAANLEAGQVTYYVDGQLVFIGAAARDGRHSLYSGVDPGPDLLLFNEGDTTGVYTSPLYLGSLFFTDQTLSASDLQQLGGPKPWGIAVPAPPLQLYARYQPPGLELSWTGGIPPYQLQTRTNLLDAPWLDVGSPVTTTMLTIPLTGSMAFFRLVASPLNSP
jgi:endonuclease/exonuclease/phosphatase family metal-dependent hydrolase